MENRKGQSTGLITGLIFGVASLAIAVIIALVIISTLNSANLFAADAEYTALTILNESNNGEIQGAWINATPYTLDSANDSTSSFVITEAWNQTTNGTAIAGQGGVILPVNYSVNPSTGIFAQAAGGVDYDNVTISYTFRHFDSLGDTGNAVGNLTTNLTAGINNVSLRLPTVLLIAAIVLILTVLAVLVGVWQKMRMGSGGI